MVIHDDGEREDLELEELKSCVMPVGERFHWPLPQAAAKDSKEIAAAAATASSSPTPMPSLSGGSLRPLSAGVAIQASGAESELQTLGSTFVAASTETAIAVDLRAAGAPGASGSGAVQGGEIAPAETTAQSFLL
jgi:hypothetical protein